MLLPFVYFWPSKRVEQTFPFSLHHRNLPFLSYQVAGQENHGFQVYILLIPYHRNGCLQPWTNRCWKAFLLVLVCLLIQPRRCNHIPPGSGRFLLWLLVEKVHYVLSERLETFICSMVSPFRFKLEDLFRLISSPVKRREIIPIRTRSSINNRCILMTIVTCIQVTCLLVQRLVEGTQIVSYWKSYLGLKTNRKNRRLCNTKRTLWLSMISSFGLYDCLQIPMHCVD